MRAYVAGVFVGAAGAVAVQVLLAIISQRGRRIEWRSSLD